MGKNSRRVGCQAPQSGQARLTTSSSTNLKNASTHEQTHIYQPKPKPHRGGTRRRPLSHGLRAILVRDDLPWQLHNRDIFHPCLEGYDKKQLRHHDLHKRSKNAVIHDDQQRRARHKRRLNFKGTQDHKQIGDTISKSRKKGGPTPLARGWAAYYVRFSYLYPLRCQ